MKTGIKSTLPRAMETCAVEKLTQTPLKAVKTVVEVLRHKLIIKVRKQVRIREQEAK